MGMIRENTNKNLPMVSILTITRNVSKTIRRCVESVINQNYPNIEYIIQDGLSTDGTVELISSYNSNIKLVSEPDNGPEDAHIKGLNRCTGDVLGMCWADEELAPNSIANAINFLTNNPGVGGIYGDVTVIDQFGNPLSNCQKPNCSSEWDLEKFIRWEIIPNYVGSYFWKAALTKSGFFDNPNCIMYDYFAKTALSYPIKYVPGFLAKFSVHKGQLSSTPKVLYGMIDSLTRSIDCLMENPKSPEWIKDMRQEAYAGIHISMVPSLSTNLDTIDAAAQMLRKGLQFKPNINQLKATLMTVYDYLMIEKRIEDAYLLLQIVRDSGIIIPEFKYARAFCKLIQDRPEEVSKVLDFF